MTKSRGKQEKDPEQIKGNPYQILLNSMLDGFLLCTGQGEILDANPAYAQLSGYSNEELTQMNIRDLDISFTEEEIIKTREEIISQGQAIFNTSHKVKSGDLLDMRVSVVNLDTRDGTLLGVFLNDRTRELRAIEEATENYDLYRNIFENASIGFAITDNKGNVLAWNQALLDISGFSDTDMQSIEHCGGFAASELEWERLVEKFERTGFLDNELIQLKRKDGHTIMANFSLRHILVGDKPRLLCLVDDVSLLMEASETLRLRINELEILHDVAMLSARAQDEDRFLEEVIKVVSKSLYPDHVGFLFLTASNRFLQPHVSYQGLRLVDMKRQVPVEGSIAGRVVRSGQPEIISDVRQEEDFLSSTPGIRSEVCLPVRSDGEIIGVMNAESKQLDFFRNQDMQLLRTIVGQVESTIERLRLFKAEQEQRQLAQALQAVSASLTSILEYETILESILISVASVVPHQASDIMVMEGDDFRFLHTRGYSERAQAFLKEFKMKASEMAFVHNVYEKGQSLLLEDTYAEPSWLLFEDTAWIRSYISTPLYMRGKVIGVLNLSSPEPNFFDAGSLDRLKAFADQTSVAITNAKLFSELEHSNQELALAYDATLEGWSRALDLRDHETEGHSQRVAEMAVRLARALKIPEDDLVDIRRGALLHDIGKVAVPDSILLKPAALSEAEWTEMRKHTVYAGQILSGLPFLKEATAIPCSHHERWDGAGYPQGLRGEEIPLSARLFAVVDVWDALCSDRPYRKAWSREQALQHIYQQSGSHFDPQVVEAFFKIFAPDWKPKIVATPPGEEQNS